ncbi:MAG: tetratricopeptide repeat protein [candidate division Zixibacteria bacterium]|nr:tetratricopeptide repeat protein [candidate division Zixibacteria bacterium]
MTLRETPDITRPTDAEPAARPTREAAPENRNQQSADDEGLDFVVTEAHSQDPDLVGGFKAAQTDPLGVESPAELMQAAARPGQTETEDMARRRQQLAEFCPLPAPPEEDFGDSSPERLGITDNKPESTQRESTIEKLSEQRIKEISLQMKAETVRSDYLSEEEARQIISRMNGDGPTPGSGVGFDTQPIIPPKRNREIDSRPGDLNISNERPRINKRDRGLAFFANGYIHVTGEQELHEGDEMSIGEREYVLRRKKFSNKIIAAIVTPLAAVIVFALGTQLSPNAHIGDGRIVGLVLNQDGQPYLSGATIRLPESGRTFETNGQGFFRSDQLPAGSYKIEYQINGDVLATDYATVSEDNITTITLKPEPAQPGAATNPTVTKAAVVSDPVLIPSEPTPIGPASRTTAATPKASPAAKAGASSQFAKLALAASVDDARLTIDGSVIGAGNLTYSKLKPGQHSYTVSKNGYKSVNGTIDLRADQTSTLDVTLQPTEPTQKTVLPERDFYNSAIGALERGDAHAAIAGLTKAVEVSPNYAEAYAKRAEAYRQTLNKQSAYEDYLHAAGIFQSRNDYDRAFSAYEEALKLNPKEPEAYLGRGSLYLKKNEAIAAAADFDQAVALDRRNVDGYIGLGRARYNQGNFDKAVKHFRDARSLDSNNPVIHQYLMLSHFGAGDYSEVRKDYDKFLKCANEEQVRQLKADPRFAPVLKTID